MALTLNTSHSLYGNLKAFICVDDDNVLKDLKSPGATFTLDGAVVIGSGTYGRHARTLNNGFFPSLITVSGASNIAATNATVLLVVNRFEGRGGGDPSVVFGGGHGTPFLRSSGALAFGRFNGGLGSVQFTADTASVVGNGAHSAAFSRTGTTSHSVYLDGASSSTGGQIGNDTDPAYPGPFGGESGQNSVGFDLVYVMVFDKALSLSEYQEIHNSLAAGNVVSLLGSGSDTTPPVITGPGGATGSTSSVSIQENTTAVHTFTANESVTWDLNGGADVAFFSINSSTGALAFLSAPDFEAPADSGSNNTYVVGVRATDGASNATTQTCTVTVTDVSDVVGTFTSEPLKRNNGTLVSSASLDWVTFLDSSDGSFVHTEAGVTTDADGIFEVADAALVTGTEYQVTWLEATGETGCGTATAT